MEEEFEDIQYGDRTSGYRSGDTRITKLSVYDNAQDLWSFLDPESISWVPYKSDISYYKIDSLPIGLVEGKVNQPNITRVIAYKPNVIYKLTIGDTIEFGYLKKEAELSTIASLDDENAEEEV